MAKKLNKKSVFKIFVSHQAKIQEILNKNRSESEDFEIGPSCSYPNNKIAILFKVSVEEPPKKPIGDSEFKIFYGLPKKVQIDLNNHHIESIVSMHSTGNYLNVLCIAKDFEKTEE